MSHIALDVIRDVKGIHSLNFVEGPLSIDMLDHLLDVHSSAVVFDLRKYVDFPNFFDLNLVDVKVMAGGHQTILSAAKAHGIECSNLERLEKIVAANARAFKTAKIDPKMHHVVDSLPPEILHEYIGERIRTIDDLYEKLRESRLVKWQDRSEFIRCVHEIELNGIRIDNDFVEKMLTTTRDPSDSKCLRSMQSLGKSGFVTNFYNVVGTKTGRLKIERGFNSMGIPKDGPCRDAIISRYDGGVIASFDFNAIDYRCIVKTIGGELERKYRGYRDFHERTTLFLFDVSTDVRRDVMKKIAYTSIYGGGLDTLADRTELSPERVKFVMEKLNPYIQDIHKFRENLWTYFKENGFIEVPGVGVFRPEPGEDMHPGKLLGIYAQGFSSYVFENAVRDVHKFLREMKSKIIFMVHDELVIDVHPDEIDLIPKIASLMELGNQFVVNVKKGKSYGKVER